ncbi:MAG TPA: HEAT repeat domain-containing protein [Polyangiales bacterium]|nr:HEAT repeat domain-containing protein [Polyangiales bacterium]
MQPRDKFSPFHPEPASSSLRASAYPEDLEAIAAGMTDDEALRKIGSRTTPFGRVVTIAMLLGAGALGYVYIENNKKFEARMEGLKEAGTLEGEPQLAKLREVLSTTTYDDVKVRAIRNLAHSKDKQSVPLLIKELEKPGVVRAQAATAIAAIGLPTAEPAKGPLLAALPSTDEKDRPQVVWALAVLKESQASDAILKEFVKGIWQKNEDFDPKVITEAIGVERLSQPDLTGSDQKPVRALVAMALSEAASPKVVPALVRMIKRPNEDPEVIRAAVGGIGRAGDPSAASDLFGLMTARSDMRQSVLEALGKSTAAPQLATLLGQAKDATTKRDLVRLLRKTYDPRAGDAYAALINDEDKDVREEAAQGLADLGDARAVPPLLAAAKSPNDDDANDALDALRQLGDPSAAEGLLPLFKEFPERKAAIMRALGTSHSMAAGPMIEKELKGDDVGAAAKALAQIPYDKAYPKLVAMLKKDPKIDFSRPSVVTEMAYRNRFEAIQALGFFGRPDPKAVKELMTIVEDLEDDARLAMVAGAALGQMADPALQELMFAKVSDPKADERIRTAYVNGLWRKPNPTLAPKLLTLLTGNAPGAVKLQAALAIGYSGSPAADDGLLKLLDDPNARRYAAVAAVLGGNEAAARKLLEVLPQDRDTEEILRGIVNSNEDDNFNLMLEPMFTSGQVYRRMKVAEILRDGDPKTEVAFTYPFVQLSARLVAGWDGTGGVSPRWIRAELYKQLTTSPDAARRKLIATMLAGMNQRGLLLAARDAGVKEAREVLLSLDRPKVSS